MSISDKKNQLTLVQERDLLNYLDALQQDDLATQEAILASYASDSLFEEAVWEVQVALGEEAMRADEVAVTAAIAAEDARLQDLIAGALNRPVAQTRADIEREMARQNAADIAALEEENGVDLLDPVPLTLRDVAARLREDLAAGLVAARNRADARAAVLRLEASAMSEPLNDDALTPRGAKNMLHRLGLGAVGAWLERLFHDAIIDLNQQREQEMFRLAAARRQKAKKNANSTSEQKEGKP